MLVDGCNFGYVLDFLGHISTCFCNRLATKALRTELMDVVHGTYPSRDACDMPCLWLKRISSHMMPKKHVHKR